MKVVVNVTLSPAFESAAQVIMAAQPEEGGEALRVLETRVVPISTSSILPGLSVNLPR